MNLSRRRMNILQVAKLVGEGAWLTPADLRQAGAYGTSNSIVRALRGMQKYGVVQHADGAWKITPEGWLRAGMVPAKRETPTEGK